MNRNRRNALIKKLPFYCLGEDCNFYKTGFNKSGDIRYKCTECLRSFFPLKTPIDFSTWSDIDKDLSKEVREYHKWKRKFDKLKTFYEAHGHTWVKRQFFGVVYSRWLSVQRTMIRHNALHPLKVKLLESIDFKIDYWGCDDDITTKIRQARTASRNPFEKQLKKILAWKEKHGRWPVKKAAVGKAERKLAVITESWRTNNRLYQEEIDLLDELGFAWNLYDENFRQKIKRIKAFKEKFGGYYIRDGKGATNYDRKTSYLISSLRSAPPAERWKLDAIKELNLGTRAQNSHE